jgi:hypothetical protein
MTSANENTNSVVLKLESLMKQYDNVLIKYQQATANYSSFLQQQGQSNSSDTPFTVLKGNAYWGTGVAGTKSVYTNTRSAIGCSALCASTKECSGATFNPNANGMPSCFLRSGNSSIVPSSSNDFAVVPLSKKYLLNIQSLNQQLTDINQEILSTIHGEGASIFSTEQTERAMKKKQLENNYRKLIEERKMIEQKLNTFQDLDQQESNSELVTNSNYMSFVLLLGVAILCIVILVKISSSGGESGTSSIEQYGGRLGNKAYYVVFGIVFVVLFLYYYKHLNWAW